MEYPGTKITRNVRRAIFVVFVALFFVISPLIIMYTQGYRYDWKNGQRREIGTMSIDIDPSDAVAHLDDYTIDTGMPIRLKNITPRKYHLSLTAPDYFTWEKDIEVENKQTVYVKEFGLIKKTSPQVIAVGAFSGLRLSYDSRWIAYYDADSVKLQDTTTDSPITIAALKKNQPPELIWAPRNHWLVIYFRSNPNASIIINADDYTRPIAISEKDPIKKIQWNDGADPELFYSTARDIKSLRPDSGNVTRVAKNTYLDWYAQDSALWTLQIATDTKNLIVVQDTVGFASVSPIIRAEILPPDYSDLSIARADSGIVILSDQTRANFYISLKDNTYKISAKNFVLSPYNSWWLFWSPWELTAYSAGADPTLINRSGEGLKQVIPLDKFNTLALLWKDKTTVLFPYYSVTHNLTDYPMREAAGDSDRHILYFTAKINDVNGVWKLEY